MIFLFCIAIIIIAYPFLISFLGRKSYFVLITFVLTVIAGLRGISVGTDTPGYYRAFEASSYFSIDTIKLIIRSKEPFFYIFQSFISAKTHNFTLFLLLIALFYNTCVSRFIFRYSANPVISYLMFFSMGYYYFSMAGIRQTIAMGFLLLAIEALLENHRIKSLVCILIASCFHVTSLIFFLVLVLYYIPLNSIYLTIIGVISIVTYRYGNLLYPIFTKFVWGDSRTYTDDFGGTSTLILLILIVAAALFVHKGLMRKPSKDNVDTEENQQYKNIQQVLIEDQLFAKMILFSIPLQVLAIYQASAFRLAMIFHIVSIALVPNVINVLATKENRFLGSLIVGGLLLVQFFVFTYYTADIVPFTFIWQ